MATTEVGLRIRANGEEAAKTVGSLRKELKQAQEDARNISAAFGLTSKEAVEAAKRVAQLKDQIQDTNEAIALFDPGAKFAAVGNALRTVAGGFTAITGAVALFGVKSEEVEKTLLKVQAALAVTEGLNTIVDAGQAFDKLKISILGSSAAQKALAVSTNLTSGAFRALGISVAATSTAFKVLRAAIITTGIGALVVAVGFLIEKLISLTSSTEDATAAQREFNKEVEEGNKAGLQAGLAFIERQRQLALARAKAEGASQAEIQKIEDDFYKQRIDAYGRFKQAQLAKGLSTAEADEAIQAEAEKREIEGYQRIADARAKAEAAAAEQAKKAADEANQRLKEYITGIEQQQKLLDAITGAGDAVDNRNTVRDQQREAELKANEDFANRNIDLVQRATATINGLQNEVVANNEKAKNDTIAAEQAKQQAYFQTGNALGQLSQLVGTQTKAGKVLALAQVAIDTGVALAGIIRQASTNPLNLTGFAFAADIASRSALVFANMVRAKQIISSSNAGSIGAGAASAGAASTPPNPLQRPELTRTQLDQQSLNAIGNAAQRVFVVESDVTNNQERIKRLNRAARLG